jgi:hypothetical protein
VQGRILAKAGFVGEDQRPVLPLRFFLRRGCSQKLWSCTVLREPRGETPRDYSPREVKDNRQT